MIMIYLHIELGTVVVSLFLNSICLSEPLIFFSQLLFFSINGSNDFSLPPFSKIQLVVYYQCYVLIG